MTKTLGAFLAVALCLLSPYAADAQSEITFATHAEGSAYYKLATSISEMLAESYDREGVISPFKRWTEYLPLIDKGEIDIGFVTEIDAGTRFRKQTGALSNLRAVARIWALRYTYIGRAAFGMKNYVGFRGRRIGLVIRNNPTMTELNRTLLKTVALGDRDVKGVDLRNFRDGINKLARGEIDAAPIIVGVPIISKVRANVPLGLNYVSLFGPKPTTKFLAEQVPGLYIATVKPSKRLPEVLEPITVASFDVFIVVAHPVPWTQVCLTRRA